MKKMLCLFSALSMVLFSSCSKDDSSTDVSSETVLPQKIIETSVENGKSGSVTYTFTYDGKKLKDIALSDASRYVYTYTGDFVTKVELFHSSVLYSTDVYAYENGKLVTKITTYAFSNAAQQKLTFVYNADGTVNANKSVIYNNQETKYDNTTLYTFANGNLVSSYISEGKEKITSTFDNKKSPFVNITGVKALLDFDSPFDFYSSNNTIKSVTENYSYQDAIIIKATVTSINKYNANNFLKEIFSGDDKNSEKLEITY